MFHRTINNRVSFVFYITNPYREVPKPDPLDSLCMDDYTPLHRSSLHWATFPAANALRYLACPQSYEPPTTICEEKNFTVTVKRLFEDKSTNNYPF